MHERLEAALAAAECILQSHARSDVPAISRIAERETTLSVAQSFPEELFIEWVAAHRTIERHNTSHRHGSRDFEAVATDEVDVCGAPATGRSTSST